MTDHREIGHTQHGFTLIEVIVVMGIIGIIAAISSPSISTFMKKYNYRGASREVLTTVMTARSNAIRDNKNWRVNLTPPDTFTLEEEILPATSPKTYTVRQTLSISSHGNGITLSNKGALGSDTCGAATGLTQASEIAFDDRGFGAGAGLVYIENAGDNSCFAVRATAGGAVRMRRYNGTTPYNVSGWK